MAEFKVDASGESARLVGSAPVRSRHAPIPHMRVRFSVP
jgi:hypothetical protein